MHVNELNLSSDMNAVLRKIAVTYPARLTWRNDRSYMYGQVTGLDIQNKEVVVQGYIKNNFLNVKRLIHMTGVNA